MNCTLKEEAIFIADSHYNDKNQEFKLALQKIEDKKILSSQIFLMGDNFDFLSYEIRYFRDINKDIIDILNRLSKEYEIFYLEGNHDYNLQKIFPNIKVIKREKQPFVIAYKDKKIALSHGDNFVNWHYNLYCKIIRNSLLLKLLNLIDINNFISKRVEKALINKNICIKLDYFDDLVQKRVKNYQEDIVIEGHYHQGTRHKINKQEYINVPSLCCQKSFLRFKYGEFFIEELKD